MKKNNYKKSRELLIDFHTIEKIKSLDVRQQVKTLVEILKKFEVKEEELEDVQLLDEGTEGTNIIKTNKDLEKIKFSINQSLTDKGLKNNNNDKCDNDDSGDDGLFPSNVPVN